MAAYYSAHGCLVSLLKTILGLVRICNQSGHALFVHSPVALMQFRTTLKHALYACSASITSSNFYLIFILLLLHAQISGEDSFVVSVFKCQGQGQNLPGFSKSNEVGFCLPSRFSLRCCFSLLRLAEPSLGTERKCVT